MSVLQSNTIREQLYAILKQIREWGKDRMELVVTESKPPKSTIEDNRPVRRVRPHWSV